MLANCFRFAPRDSVPGLIAKICKYLKDHPGWSEVELEEQIRQLVGQTGVASFNGRTGDIILTDKDVNNLKISSAYFAEGNETIENLNLVELYKQGIRFVFTNWNSVTSGYDKSFVLDYFGGSGNVVYYPIASASGGSSDSPVVSVNSMVGAVTIPVVDVSESDSQNQFAKIFINEGEDYPIKPSYDSDRLGGKPPSYYADAKVVDDKLIKLNEAINAKGDPTDEQVRAAVNEYLSNNPATVITAAAIQDINIKKWVGKKIVVDGSSITAGGSGNTIPTWHKFLKDMFALNTVYDHSLSGSGWFIGGTTTTMDRVADYESDADAVILMGDYNGIYAYTSNAGKIDDAPAADGSYYAKLKYLAEKLITKYPMCPVIWVVEPPRGAQGDGKTPMDYASIYALQSKCIEEVADYYGFTHCNLMKSTIFRPWNETNYAATTSDGTHPWNNIQRTMAQVIAETMKRTPIIYNESYVLDTSGSTGSGGGETEATLTKITASLPSSYELYTTDTLDVVRGYLTVKAVYSDLSEVVVNDYTIDGTLEEGTSTLTIGYGGMTTTVDVTVTSGNRTVTVKQSSIIANDLNGKYILNATVGNNKSSITYKDYANTGVSRPISVMPGTVVAFSSNPDQGKGTGYPSLTSNDIVFFDADDVIVSTGNAVAGSWSFTAPDNARTFIIVAANNSEYYFISYTPGT